MEFDESLLIQRHDNVNTTSGAETSQQLTLHCQQCNTVLSDSSGVCGEIHCLDSVLCIRVTEDVVVSDVMESGYKGEMVHCIYSSLKCRGCRCAVGKVIHSAPSRLAMIRSLFLLHKANISCYILNSSSMVKASTLTFDVKPLTESITELKQQSEAHLHQMSRIKRRLADRSVTRKLNK